MESSKAKPADKKTERPASEHFVKPKLNLSLKLEVARVPLVERPLYQEAAETLEEMLILLHDKGGHLPPDTHLPPRPHRVPGKTINHAI